MLSEIINIITVIFVKLIESLKQQYRLLTYPIEPQPTTEPQPVVELQVEQEPVVELQAEQDMCFDPSEMVFDKKCLRHLTTEIVAQEKFIRLINDNLPKPLGSALGILCNMLTLASYLKLHFKYIIKLNKEKFYESCRDISVLVGQYDTIAAKYLQNQIEKGIDITDPAILYREINNAFQNMFNKSWCEWLKSSQKKIKKHLSLLAGLVNHADLHDAQLINILVQKSLLAAPIGEIIEIDDDDDDEINQ